MKYYIRSGKLYTSGSPGSSACLCSIAGPFFTAAKSVEGEKGELILRTSIVHDRTRKYPEAKSYQMEAPDGSVLAEGHLLYAEGEHPQCLGRLPRVDRVALTAGSRPYTLWMRNSQYYVLSAEEPPAEKLPAEASPPSRQSSSSRAMEIIHNQDAGGWNVEASESFSPGMIMGVFIFSRYLDKENEFVIV